MNDGFVVLAMDKGRNWTGTANDRFREIDPISDLVATVRARPTAGKARIESYKATPRAWGVGSRRFVGL